MVIIFLTITVVQITVIGTLLARVVSSLEMIVLK